MKIRKILAAAPACCLLLISSCGTPETDSGGAYVYVKLPK